MDFTWNEEQGRVKVTLRCLLQNGDGMFWLYGGDRPHLGAVGIWSRGGEPQVTVFPGHKEGVVVQEAVCRLAGSGKLGNVTLGCGIHLDRIKPEEIALVLTLCRRLTGRLIETLERGEA